MKVQYTPDGIMLLSHHRACNISTHKHLRSLAFEITKNTKFEACFFEDRGSSESLISAAVDESLLLETRRCCPKRMPDCFIFVHEVNCFGFSMRFMLVVTRFSGSLSFYSLQTLLKRQLPSQRHSALFFCRYHERTGMLPVRGANMHLLLCFFFIFF